MFLRKYYKESALERLEREANDDVGLLKELGPEHFSNHHLLDLREELRRRLDHFDRVKKMLMLLGFSSAGWFVGGVGFLLGGWEHVAAVAYGISGLSMLGFIAGVWYLKWKYDSRGELMHTLIEVEEELRKRASLKGRGAPLR